MTAGEGLTAEALTALCYEVEDLFDACRIRIADYDSPHLVVRSDDHVVAALVSGDAYAGGAPSGVMRFSVCVCPYHRRQGHARRLVEAFIEHCEEQGLLSRGGTRTAEHWAATQSYEGTGTKGALPKAMKTREPLLQSFRMQSLHRRRLDRRRRRGQLRRRPARQSGDLAWGSGVHGRRSARRLCRRRGRWARLRAPRQWNR